MYCFVKGCPNAKRNLPRNPNISFHRFPKLPNLFRLWLEALGLDDPNIEWKQNMHICSDHFKKGEVIRARDGNYLVGDVVPSVNIFNVKNNQKNGTDYMKNETRDSKEVEHIMEEEEPSTCRICSNQIIDIENRILLQYQIDGRNESIKDCILNCVPGLQPALSENDAICENCINELVVAVNFIEKCKKSAQKLETDPKKTNVETSVETDDKYDSPGDDIDNSHIIDTDDISPQTNDFLIDIRKSNDAPNVQQLLQKLGVNIFKCVIDQHKKKRIMLLGSTDCENAIDSSKKNIKFACLKCCEIFTKKIFCVDHFIDQHLMEGMDKKENEESDYKFYDLENQKRLKIEETTGIFSLRGLENTFPNFHIDLTNVGTNTVRMVGASQDVNKRVILLGTLNTDKALKLKRKVFKCLCCPKMFVNSKSYEDHFKYDHLKMCIKCAQVFEDADALTVHSKECIVPIKFECTKCNRKFKSQAMLDQHTKHFKDSTFCTVKCPRCNWKFNNYKKFEDHVNEADCGNKPKVKEELCEQCGKQFASKVLLASHKATHMEKEEFMCQNCGKICKGKPAFRLHMRKHDPNRSKRTFMCDQCPKEFNTEHGVLAHRAKVHENKILFPCDKCNKSFVTKSGLFGHMRYFHMGQTYKCNICGERCKRPDYLRRHLRAHDRLGDNVNYIATINRQKNQPKAPPVKKKDDKKHISKAPVLCKICHKLIRPSGVRNHYRSHVNYRPYKCRFCTYSFSSGPNRRRHERIHNDPTYHLRCNICYLRFKKQSDLNMHMRKHQTNLKYECDLCGEKFGRVHLLENHKVNSHPETIEEREELYNDLIKEFVHVIEPGEEDKYNMDGRVIRVNLEGDDGLMETIHIEQMEDDDF